MRIRVTGAGHNITIPIPTRLIFSKPSVWLYLKLARKFASCAQNYIPEDTDYAADKMMAQIPKEAAYALCAEIIRIKRQHGRWTLVEVHSSDGSGVEITL
jgi:hypothetical protein